MLRPITYVPERSSLGAYFARKELASKYNNSTTTTHILNNSSVQTIPLTGK